MSDFPRSRTARKSFAESKGQSDPTSATIPICVYYEDTDFSGRVYHASYLRFFERGRTEWLRGRGLTHLDFATSTGIVFAVRSLQVEYLAPAVIDDLLAVETRVSTWRGASLEFQQRIVRGDRELVVATVLVVAIRDDRPARLRRRLLASLREPR